MSFILAFFGGGFLGIALMCLLQINKKDCLHCGKGTASYCESCYQELIGINAKLQKEVKDLKEQLHKNDDDIERHIPRID